MTDSQPFGTKSSTANGGRKHAWKRGWLLLAVTLLVVSIIAACSLPPKSGVANSPPKATEPGKTPYTVDSVPTEAAPAKVAAGFQPVTAQDGIVTIPLSDLSGSTARFFSYQSGEKTINFLILTSSDGVVRAAFDACDVCWAAHKGYHQEGDELVCNNCGTRFPSVKINEVKGGCNPSPLIRSVQGDNLTIAVSDIESGAKFF